MVRSPSRLRLKGAVAGRALQNAILSAAEERAPRGTLCPSEVARSLWPDDWRTHLDEVREAAWKLRSLELLEVTQRGKPVESSKVTGPIRLKARGPASLQNEFRGRLGLCCQFTEQPIRFRTTTATYLARLSQRERQLKLSEICLSNAESLLAALQFCSDNQIGAFRIASTLFPAQTHPEVGYSITSLPEADAIRKTLDECKQFATQHHLRTSFHPDQFVVLNSPRPEVVERSVRDLEAHAEMAELVGADVINIHGGGAFGDKDMALASLSRQIDRLPDRIRDRLTLENDDRVFTPADLLPVCRMSGIPLVYDVHHHRCCTDGLSLEEATEAALATWNREPLFHLSSPQNGWTGPYPERHHDNLDPRDFPSSWLPLAITVDIEAKGKEVAVLKLMESLQPTHLSG